MRKLNGFNRLLMVGTALEGKGGVASVLRTWRDEGLFRRWGIDYIATNGGKHRLGKFVASLRAWLLCLLLVGRRSLVHVHTSSYISFWRKTPVFAIAMLLKRPLVVSLHGGAFREFYGSLGSAGQAWIRLVMRRAMRFVVLTEEWRRWAEAVEPLARVAVIPNPVPELPILTDDRTGVDPTLLFFLGRIEADKGLFVLLDALSKARAAGALWRLVCGGQGNLQAARDAALALGLMDEDVQFVGWVDGPEKHRLLRECAVLVLPSFIENMPVVILEAFAYAKPVIATRVGGIPDVVTPDVDGFLVEARDAEALAAALIGAFENRDRLAQMGANARLKVEARYSPATVLAKVDELYRECFSSDSYRNGQGAH